MQDKVQVAHKQSPEDLEALQSIIEISHHKRADGPLKIQRQATGRRKWVTVAEVGRVPVTGR